MTRRLFVALRLGEDLGRAVASSVRTALGIRERDDPPRHLRLYGARDLHLTLFFLGATAEEQVAPLEGALGEASAGLAAPELEIAAAGAFPDARRPKILWLGTREHGPARLAKVVDAVRSAACGLGFQADPRPFAAHVTVARVRAGRERAPSIPPDFFALDPRLAWQPPALELVESLVGARGDAYRSLRAWPLPGAKP